MSDFIKYNYSIRKLFSWSSSCCFENAMSILNQNFEVLVVSADCFEWDWDLQSTRPRPRFPVPRSRRDRHRSRDKTRSRDLHHCTKVTRVWLGNGGQGFGVEGVKVSYFVFWSINFKLRGHCHPLHMTQNSDAVYGANGDGNNFFKLYKELKRELFAPQQCSN